MRHVAQMFRKWRWVGMAAVIWATAGDAVAAPPADPGIFLDLQPLTKRQRLEDFAWIVSSFEEFYAPLNYKQERWGFDWDQLVQSYRERISRRHMSHRQFAAVMQQFVSEMHDAHTSLSAWRDAIVGGGDMQVSTLGFHTKRKLSGKTDGVYVAALLPGFFSSGAAPLRIDDRIVSIDGRPVDTIIREDLQPYQTTGREDSDATLLARSLTFRVSTMWPVRPRGTVDVEFVRGAQVQRVRLDWVEVSLTELYQDERARLDSGAGVPAATMAQSKLIGKTQDNRWVVQVNAQPSWRHLMQAEQSGYSGFEHQFALQPHVAFFNTVGRLESTGASGWGTPIVVDNLAFRLFKTKRGLAAVYRVEDFVYSRMRCGKSIAVDTSFGYALCEPLTGEDYSRAFNKLADTGVTDLVLDLRANGGGLLTHSDNLLRAFASHEIPAQAATVRVNESWLGNFVALGNGRAEALAERVLFRDQERVLRRDIAAKRRISTPVHLQGVKMLAANPMATQLRTFVMIDELCASACDLFAAGMQDNKLATILGRQSMGAGGNVVNVGESPHEKLALTQTASLIYRADGSFLENEGVKPDIEISTHVDYEIWPQVVQAIERQPAAGAQATAPALGGAATPAAVDGQ